MVVSVHPSPMTWDPFLPGAPAQVLGVISPSSDPRSLKKDQCDYILTGKSRVSPCEDSFSTHNTSDTKMCGFSHTKPFSSSPQIPAEGPTVLF